MTAWHRGDPSCPRLFAMSGLDFCCFTDISQSLLSLLENTQTAVGWPFVMPCLHCPGEPKPFLLSIYFATDLAGKSLSD